MANTISIDIEAVDMASGILGNVWNTVRNGANAVDLVAAAFTAAAIYTKNARDEAFDYDQQIKQLMITTGGSADANSRLVQTLDDAGIGYDTVKRAMKEMSKDGAEPNIQTLARLSDEFLTLNSGADRGKFLLDNFGKSGEDMARAMELGGAALLKMNAAQQGGLILTEQNIIAAEQLRKNTDELNDSQQALAITWGNTIIPVQSRATDMLNDLILTMQSHGSVQDWMEERVRKGKEEMIAASDATAAHGDALDGAIVSMQDFGAATTLTATEINEMTKANNSHLSLIKRLQVDTKNYNKNLAEMTEKYGENSEEVKQLEADHKAAMQSIVYDLYIAKLQADGFTDAEFKMALEAGVASGQIDRATANMALAMDETAQSAINLGTDIQNVGDIADAISGTYQLTFNATMTGQWPSGSGFDFPASEDGPICFIAGTRVLSGNTHKPIESLKVGDFVRSYDVEAGQFVDVSIAEIFKREVNGYLLINGIGVTAEHPFYANGEWVKAGQLKRGDVLMAEDKSLVVIEQIQTIDATATVYNLHTATEPHNYFAGGVLVHNKAVGFGAQSAGGMDPYTSELSKSRQVDELAEKIGIAVARNLAQYVR